MKLKKPKVTIRTFTDDTADVSVDGQVVGWLERVYDERFASASSRARVRFVSHYTVVLKDDDADEALHGVEDFDSRGDAKRAVESVYQRLQQQRSLESIKQP